jgi:hypothetical protein
MEVVVLSQKMRIDLESGRRRMRVPVSAAIALQAQERPSAR